MKKYLFGLGAMLVGAGLMLVLMHGEVRAEWDSKDFETEFYLELDLALSGKTSAEYYKDIDNPERNFVARCMVYHIRSKFSLELAKRIDNSISMRHYRKYKQKKEQSKLPAIHSIDDFPPSIGNQPVMQRLVKVCRNFKSELQPKFKSLIDRKLFGDLRPDLAKLAKDHFYRNSFRKGPPTVSKYISLIQLTTNKEKWLETDKKYGRKLIKDINWQYKVANCEQFELSGQVGRFLSSFKEHIAQQQKDKQKCMEEKNLIPK